MRLLALAAAAALALPAAAQDAPTGFTVSAGYASGYEAGAVHGEARVRFAPSGKVGLEPMASWTQGLGYEQTWTGGCVGGGPCVSWVEGEQDIAVGTALTYRARRGALPLGLDAHMGVFGQMLLPFWDRGQRVGVEVGGALPLGRARVGVDVQVARYTHDDRVSATPLFRLAVGR